MERFMQTESVFPGHASSQRSSEELDFNDVFGGPPRRFSMQEVRARYSFGETEEEKASLMEKPVFGEESTPRRRHQGQSNDFFYDIFRGSEEGYSSPRRGGDGVFGSNPGSRIMSPAARPLTPRAEPFGTSLPSQFSLPAKLTKTTEFPTFFPINHGQHKIDSSTNGLNSPHSSSPLSRFSNQANEFKNVYRQSPFSSNEDSLRSDDSAGNQFHFSIYKWAGRGVPMLMPFVAKNNLKSKGLLKEDLKGKKEIKKKLQSFLEGSPEEKSQSSPNDAVAFDEDMNVGEKIEQKQAPLKIEEESQRLKPRLTDDFEQPETKEKTATTPEGVDSNYVRVEEPNLKSGAKNSKKSGVKGKVKEFVQIFNQEGPDARTKTNVLRKSQSLRWKNVEIDQKENEESPNAAKLDEKVDSSNVAKKPDVSLKVDENLNNDEAKRHSPTRTSSYPSNRSSTNMKKSFSSESFKRDSKMSVENSDDPFEVNFQVQELSDDHENVTQSESSEDLKAMDAKIKQWSVGKKGNIRSLLSTLQYVLWPGSGWKAIPLVDLIEANSVKRAYQKALLRLHPDKLQQKGAASHQKYIAENVFDILQEAWDHFNNLGPL